MNEDEKDEKREPEPWAEGYVPEDYLSPDPVLESLRRMRAAS